MILKRENLLEKFPILNRNINGHKIVYADNAAMGLKPLNVLSELKNFYFEHCANVYRSGHSLGSEITELVESSREEIANFFNVKSQNIIFTSGTTEAINLVAFGLSERLSKNFFNVGDEIIVSTMEHNSNILPWQVISKKYNLKLKYADYNDDYRLDSDSFDKLLSKRTKFVALTMVSNLLGTINELNDIIKKIKSYNSKILVLVDGAQAIPHFSVDLKRLRSDFFVFSGYKIGAPTGVGVLYGKTEILKMIEPLKYGGGSVSKVKLDYFELSEIPYRFEGGTLPIESIIGLRSAIKFINSVSYEEIIQKEKELIRYFLKKFINFKKKSNLSISKKIKLIGSLKEINRVPIFTLYIEGIHPHDIASIFDSYGIEVRSGHHCAMLIMQKENICGSIRLSFSYYNSTNDIDRIFKVIENLEYLFEKGCSL